LKLKSYCQEHEIALKNIYKKPKKCIESSYTDETCLSCNKCKSIFHPDIEPPKMKKIECPNDCGCILSYSCFEGGPETLILIEYDYETKEEFQYYEMYCNNCQEYWKLNVKGGELEYIDIVDDEYR
jgi:hypothetical protein